MERGVASDRPAGGSRRRFWIELGPALVFFAANFKFGLLGATAALMAATVAALAFSLAVDRRMPTLPVVTACFVLVFGSLTLLLRDETFIKFKPTAVYSLLAVTLLVGLWMRRFFLKILLEQAVALTEEGWRKLTVRWIVFFLALAALNEWVRRAFSNDVWVTFKTFGIAGLTIAFAALQIPFLQRHSSDARAGS